jgi:hypothetical protein
MIVASLKWSRHIVAVGLLSLFIAGAASAATPIAPVNTEHGLAIKGYDPVAYFTAGKPTRGSANFATTYQGGGLPFRLSGKP